MNAYEVPLSAQAQTFTLDLDDVAYNLTLQWRAVDGIGGWVLDIADASNNAILEGIPLVTGVDLLGQYVYLGFGGGLWVLTDGDALAVPTYSNLGTLAHLYFYST